MDGGGGQDIKEVCVDPWYEEVEDSSKVIR